MANGAGRRGGAKDYLQALVLRVFRRGRTNRRQKEWSSRTITWVQASVAAAMVVCVALMFPGSGSVDTFNLREGDVYIGDQIIAPFTFAINKSPQEYAADVEAAKRRVPAVFVRRAEVPDQQRAALESFLDQLYQVWSAPGTVGQKSDSLSGLLRRFGIVMTDSDLSFFLERKAPLRRTRPPAKANGEVGTGRLFTMLQEVVTEALKVGVLDTEKDRLPTGAEKISVVSDGVETIEELAYYRGPKEAQDFALEKIRQNVGADAQMTKVAFQIAIRFLQPNVFLDAAETQARVAAEVASVPRAKGMVLEGERIIDSHEKVTAHHVEVLASLAEARAEQGSHTLVTLALRFLGRMLLTVVALGVVALFLYRERRSLLYDPRQLLLLALVVLLVVAVAYGVNRLSLSSNLVPVAVAAMLLTIFFDARVAFIAIVGLGLILGGMRGNDFALVATAVLVGSVASLSVTKVQKRNWVVRSMLMTSLAYAVCITVLGLLREAPLSALAKEWTYGLTNGIVSPLITYGLVVVLELAFEITTDMTYLELSDLNNPLLRELALVAPGTYHHSIMVGNLAEAGAEVIGANALLVRVGAYYHDIGKMEKPEYFVENQRGGRNPQDRLSPTMSALLLVNHVRRGAEMAKEHGLPAEIRDCLEQHHGTSVMAYFYEKAKGQNGGNAVREDEFRYPGPKPQTKEAALLMLADAVEAASRSLREPSVSRLRALVSQIIDDRFRAGELDESPLTLRDLNKVGEAFLKFLIGRYHRRLEYPKSEAQEAAGPEVRR
ncbi:MAG: HDIG domain-containing protein [bacterium]|jgi:putative nucleotidyltransferase with HDIG domain|nr:HDIG domain-containing protein [candidate division KSB1 bacterium]MDH7559727.1 HDIG domain-containing protein [bacterium]